MNKEISTTVKALGVVAERTIRRTSSNVRMENFCHSVFTGKEKRPVAGMFLNLIVQVLDARNKMR